METGEIKTGLTVVERLGIPLNELRGLALVLDMAREAKLVFVPVESSPGADATGHLGMTSKAPLVVDIAVRGVTRVAIVRVGKPGVESAQGTGRFFRRELWGLGAEEQQNI
jgi:hypothetical protein